MPGADKAPSVQSEGCFGPISDDPVSTAHEQGGHPEMSP